MPVEIVMFVVRMAMRQTVMLNCYKQSRVLNNRQRLATVVIG